jgi:hypothetical protein
MERDVSGDTARKGQVLRVGIYDPLDLDKPVEFIGPPLPYTISQVSEIKALLWTLNSKSPRFVVAIFPENHDSRTG